MASCSSPSVTSRQFGQLPDGGIVDSWTLRGRGGLELEVLTFGGIITRLLVPDSAGDKADVVMGFDSLPPYLDRHPYFGAIVGRIAGRIPGGRLPVLGKVYSLVLNEGSNHIHGGRNALDRKNWQASVVEREDGCPSLALSYISPDGEENYPGRVAFTVTYTVLDNNTFVFETLAESLDQPTPVSLTHHGYFHLSGKFEETILNHRVQLFSDEVARADENMILQGDRIPVDPANDFREMANLDDRIDKLWKQHGDLYWVGRHPEPFPVARVEDPLSGRVLEVSTTNSCLQFYTGVNLDGTVRGKGNTLYPKHGAFCLECEEFPDALNHPQWEDILVHPKHPQHHLTLYRFTTI